MTRATAAARVQHTVVFPDGGGGGNPCPVVLGADGWPTERLQAVAAGFGHETGFVLSPQAGGDVRLRYFVPRHEMEMCVHATVAAVVLLGRHGSIPESVTTIETPLGTRTARWDRATCSAVVQQSPPTFGAPIDSVGEPLDILGLGEAQLDATVGPVQSVSTARAKLMIPLVDERALDAIDLDPHAAWELCDRLLVGERTWGTDLGGNRAQNRTSGCLADGSSPSEQGWLRRTCSPRARAARRAVTLRRRS